MLRPSEEHTRVLRQRIVSSARLRGLKIADIVDLLEKEGIVNPRTGTPWCAATISKDIKCVAGEWKQEMLADISDHRARVLAEINEVKRSAWKTGKHAIVLRAIEQEVNLLGLNELERMGVEIALANLLKGIPAEVADALKKRLAKRISDQKKMAGKANVIDIIAKREQIAST